MLKWSSDWLANELPSQPIVYTPWDGQIVVSWQSVWVVKLEMYLPVLDPLQAQSYSVTAMKMVWRDAMQRLRVDILIIFIFMEQ
jgi:hypothetical protein